MEVRVPNFHSFVEGITASYIRTPACWDSRSAWDSDIFYEPDVIKVGGAYCCTQCCGVLYYGAPPTDGICFPHHKCHQQLSRVDNPLLRFVKIGRTTEHLLDQYAVILSCIADHYEQAARSRTSMCGGDALMSLDIIMRTESLRTDRPVDPDFWTAPLDRREPDARSDIATAGWRMIDASSQSQTVPDCVVSNLLHTRHVFSQMLTTTTAYDVAVTGKPAKFSPLVAVMPTRDSGIISLTRDNWDHDVEGVWLNGFAFSPIIGGVGISGQFERGACHNYGHPMVGSGKKVSHYRNLFMEVCRGWSRSSFTCAVGLEPAECELRLRGQARTMLGRALPDVCDFDETTHTGQSSAPLRRSSKVSFIECGW
uniref:Sigma-B protein n=1 Tax=Muscovy duck reovirus TaxID=77153 RepID=Q9YQQ8_9REOV|nr:sigma-B protein [Muscovy duck reovirus]